MTYEIALKRKIDIADGTVEFTFEKPEGYAFKAGQFSYLTLINPEESDAEGDTRIFSIISAPQEDSLVFATRMRDTAFKRILKKMNIGDKVKIDLPMGSFTLHENLDNPAVFLVGGIGITPFMSMLRDTIFTKSTRLIYIFYSNRRPEDTAYLAELQNMEKNNKNIIFVPTMTDMSKSSEVWKGETSKIGIEIVRKHVPDISNAIYYTAGPQPMVRAMRTFLNEATVSSSSIMAEEFSGY